MKRYYLSSLFLCLVLVGMAQRSGNIPEAILTWRHSVQEKDYLMGFDIGVTNRKQNLIGQLVFDFRPHSRKVQEYVGNNTFFQYAEKRYVIGAGLEYLQSLQEGNKGVFVGLNGVYNFGEYRGVSFRPTQGWSVLPRVGMFWNFLQDFAYLKLGYQYLDSRSDTIKRHWIFLSFSFILDPL